MQGIGGVSVGTGVGITSGVAVISGLGNCVGLTASTGTTIAGAAGVETLPQPVIIRENSTKKVIKESLMGFIMFLSLF
jgi:hypothetical protein